MAGGNARRKNDKGGVPMIMLIIYAIASYWAMDRVWWSKRAYLYGDTFLFYCTRIVYAMLCGWFMIPVALVMMLMGK